MAPGGLGGWLSGYVVLRVRTGTPAHFLNALLAARIPFRQARSDALGLRLRMPISGFRGLRPAIRGQHARVRIVRRVGLPFALAKPGRRPALLAASAAAAVVLYVLSGSVWFIQIRGTDRIPPAEVARAAASLGLRPGVRRGALDTAKIAQRLPVVLPELTWAAVTVHGTLATVQVVERVRPAPAYEQAMQPGDVVAAHGGIVAGIQVLAGQAVVHVGDTVEPGAILIRGLMQMPVARSRSAGIEGMRILPIHASGIVTARQRYQTYAEVTRLEEVGPETGRVFVRRQVLIGGRAVNLQGFGAVPFAAYRLRRQVRGPLRFRGIPLPLELVTLRYTEIRSETTLLSTEQAAALAAAEARAFLLQQLPPRSRLLQEHQTVTWLPGQRVGVELSVETEDNIGVFRPAADAATATDGAP